MKFPSKLYLVVSDDFEYYDVDVSFLHPRTFKTIKKALLRCKKKNDPIFNPYRKNWIVKEIDLPKCNTIK
jgi:hypothetical protein